MKYNCTICKQDKEGKKYVYASSTKSVRIFVCPGCHKAKLEEMNKETRNILGSEASLGVLKFKEDE